MIAVARQRAGTLPQPQQLSRWSARLKGFLVAAAGRTAHIDDFAFAFVRMNDAY